MRTAHTAVVRSFFLLTVLMLPILQGCLPARSSAVPPDLRAKAQIAGMPGIRYWGGDDPVDFVSDGIESVRREQAALAASGHKGPLPPANFLAISGGGDNGAFGAGLLVGWTAAGTRPSFKGVTGVSTGALIAPFAFLGPAYDATLKELYTTISADKVMESRGFMAALTNDALADNAPLATLVRHYANQQMFDAIAAEYAKGRLLLIGTTDLDARRGVIWNIGKMAASGDPKALQLFQQLLVASAAIPGAFPPSMIDVEADGKAYQEMHVDGGASAQVFAYPPATRLDQSCETYKICRDRTLYVIRNAQIAPEWSQVDRQTLSIAGKAIQSLIQTQGIGDLYRIYATAQRDKVDFNLAYIPGSFKAEHKEEFDTLYMRQLFDLGYSLAAKGYPWAKTPPGFSGPLNPAVPSQPAVSAPQS
jgi:predicted acylesterase/phospholipase RssA